MISVRQVKAARALLAWSQGDLAQKSAVSEPTIARLESLDGDLGGRESTISAIRGALEAAGIQFVNDRASLGVVMRANARDAKRRQRDDD